MEIRYTCLTEARYLSPPGDRCCLTEARVPSFNGEKIDKNPPLRHFAYILRHNITFHPVEIRNTCLSEVSSVISFKVRGEVMRSEVMRIEMRGEKK